MEPLLLRQCRAVCAIMDTLCKDTRYGVVYDETTHAVLPGRIPVARPVGGAWDVGAYQLAGAFESMRLFLT